MIVVCNDDDDDREGAVLEGTDRILLVKNGIEGNRFIVPAK